MAAITYWVDDATGNDSTGDGSVGSPFKTSTKAVQTVNGDGDGNDYTINVCDTGTYSLDTSFSSLTVDSQPNSTILIRGVAGLGDTSPALVTYTDTATSICPLIYARTVGTVTIRGIYIDTSANGNARFICANDTDGGDLVTESCWMKHGAQAGGLPYWIQFLGGFTRSQTVTLSNCVIEEMRNGMTVGDMAMVIDNCVFLYDYDTGVSSHTALFPFSLSHEAPESVTYTNNTFFVRAVGTLCDHSPEIFSHNPNTNDAGGVTLTNNVYYGTWQENAIAPYLLGGGSATELYSSGTISNNIYYFGKTSTYTTKIYDEPFTAITPTNDVELYEKTTAELFNGVDTPYDWTTDDGYTLTLPHDLRLIAETTSGSGGSLPGALPATIVDPSISGSTTSTTSILEGDKLYVTFTYTEDAGDNTSGTTVSLSYPAALTLSATKTSFGSVASDIWTISGTSAGGTATLLLTFTVGEVTAGTDYNVTATITAHGSGTSLGGTTSDDTDTVTFTALAIEGGVTDPDSPSRVQYIDVLPTTEPRFKIDTNIRLRTRRNRQEEHLLRYDEEDTLFSEFRGAVVSLATNTSSTFNMGGIERASYLLYESDNAIQLAINGGTFLPSATQMAITKGAISSLKIKNPSSTDTAEVFLLVVD